MRRLNPLLIVIFCVYLNNLIFAAGKPSPEVLEVAQNFAQRYYGGTIDHGVPYYGPGMGDVVWIFTVYKGSESFPSSVEIKNNKNNCSFLSYSHVYKKYGWHNKI